MAEAPAPHGRSLVAAAVSALLLAIGLVVAGPAPVGPSLPLNLIVVLTDDQTLSSMAGSPVAMPWLSAQLSDPGSGWWSFSDAVVSTPFCCPSRATILTGRYAWATGVVDNHTGDRLDATDTIATRLRAAGYRTAMIGKYLNEYPWGREPFIPPGWDRWLAKTNESEHTTYYDYPLVDQGRWRQAGAGPGDYVTDVLGRAAVDFVRTAPTDRPFFLYFAPPAPHRPSTASGLDADVLRQEPPLTPTATELNDVSGKPPWVQALPALDSGALADLRVERLQERASLRDVDRWIARLFDVLAWRGDLDRTAVVFLSDNGYTFGEHRWVGKQTPYEPSIRVPFAIRMPSTPGGTIDVPVSNADVAPTLAALAGLEPIPRADGRSLLPLLMPGAAPSDLVDRAIPLGWAGSDEVPAWVGVRTADAVAIRWADGFEEVYDLRTDPAELHNLIGTGSGRRLSARLGPLVPPSLAPVEGGG